MDIERYHVRLFSAFLVAILISTSHAFALDDILSCPAINSSQCRSSLLTDLAWAGDRIVAVGERGHIILTDDQGKTWRQAAVPVSVNINAVCFVTPQKGWAVGHDAVVLHSNDSGESWQKQLDGFAVVQIMLAVAKDNLASLEEKQAEGTRDLSYEVEMARWRLKDAERDVSVGPSKPFMDVWFKDEKEGFVVGAFGYFFRTIDGGKTWEDAEKLLENPEGMHLYAISGVKGGDIYITGEAGHVFRSGDGGAIWETVSLPYEGSIFGVLGTPTDGLLYLYGLRGNAFRSEDHGHNWQPLETHTQASFFSGAALPEGKALFVGQDGVIVCCDENGCRLIPREDRTTLTSATDLGAGRVLLLGMCGEEVITLPDSAANVTQRSSESSQPL